MHESAVCRVHRALDQNSIELSAPVPCNDRSVYEFYAVSTPLKLLVNDLCAGLDKAIAFTVIYYVR